MDVVRLNEEAAAHQLMFPPLPSNQFYGILETYTSTICPTSEYFITPL